MYNIIFDLDLTLVDSTIAEEAKKEKNWPIVYNLIPRFRLYNGMQDVFSFIRDAECKVAIVSTSPGVYVKKVIEYFSIPVQVVIGYHDAYRKPSPDGMIKAMKAMNAQPHNTISFGDRPIDIIASKAADIKSVGCTWGTKNLIQLTASKPDILINEPLGIIELIK